MDWHEKQFAFSALNNYEGKEYVFSGTIIREPDQRERTTHLYIQSGDDIILLYVDRFKNFTYGDNVLVSGILEQPDSFETELGKNF